MANRLQYEKSPYLQQHRDNPVDWYPWCGEAFERAKREDKPIFLSIGYSTCHWCHVMAQESFEDERIAAMLNLYFVSVKVDREERPDVDSVYMSVCQAITRGAGGWPLTIIMTPQQEPFFAGTYLPPENRYGRTGLLEILKRVAALWKNDRRGLLEYGRKVTEALSNREQKEADAPDRGLAQEACRLLREQYDAKWGGFGVVSKFPTPHNLLFLMEYAMREKKPEAMEMACRTLDSMARGGIHDHIGGGFSRYSTDAMWLVPHFEKMLYDNALLILAYLAAWQLTGKEAYARIVSSTADYILRELTDGQGGFYCGQDADSDGEEGKYYTLSREEILSVLGEQDGEEFCRCYNITQEGIFEGKNIPNRIGRRGEGWSAEDARMKKLRDYRLGRVKLHRDEKILFSWNGWAIIALARAGVVLGRNRYLDAAVRAQRFLEEKMTGADGRLCLRYCDGEAAYAGQLEDYAVYGLALLELYRATFRVEYLEGALEQARQIRKYFADEEQGGYFLTASDGEKLIIRPKEVYDGAMPSGNSVTAMLLWQLGEFTGESQWREAAWRQAAYLSGEIRDYPAGHGYGLLALMRECYPHRELICASREGIPEKLREYLRKYAAESLSVHIRTAENGEALAACAPFTADYPLPERGCVYYLCEGGCCKAPTEDFDSLGLEDQISSGMQEEVDNRKNIW